MNTYNLFDKLYLIDNCIYYNSGENTYGKTYARKDDCYIISKKDYPKLNNVRFIISSYKQYLYLINIIKDLNTLEEFKGLFNIVINSEDEFKILMLHNIALSFRFICNSENISFGVNKYIKNLDDLKLFMSKDDTFNKDLVFIKLEG